MCRKYFSIKIILFALCLFANNTNAQKTSGKLKTVDFSKQSTGSGAYHLKWQVNPFNHRVFIQNNGQFDSEINKSDKIFYQAKLGNAAMYYTAHGAVYRYDKYAGKNVKPVTSYVAIEWLGASNNAFIKPEEKQSYYYTYPKGSNSTVKASVYKKIVYCNIYPGIDVEYTFPKDKQGIKYTLIVHPGANLSAVKLKYNGVKNALLNTNGNIVLNTAMGDFTDHVPVSYYKEGGGSVSVSYVLNGTTESFSIGGAYSKSSTLVIDPWTTNPIFTASDDKAYDVDYDDNGNVYAYGGYSPFQLVKINNAGAIQWTFNASTIDGVLYGGFAVDKATGESYIIEGAHASGARALKVNTLGALVATFPGNANMNEMWRAAYYQCSRTLVIGAGGTSSNYQACVLDTNMTNLSMVNVLNATLPGHSVALMTLDSDACYMAMAKSAVIDTASFNNVLLKVSLTSLSPTKYIVPDGYNFSELASVNYVGPGPGYANGMNGMAAGPKYLYMSDGGILKKINKQTGVTINSAFLANSPFAWGGLATDMCNNVYAGNQSSIDVFDTTLALINTITAPGVVYDVVMGPLEESLYACGRAFVSAFDIPPPSLSLHAKVFHDVCGCNASIEDTLYACNGIDAINLSYLWSNGQTTRTATGLCVGKYSVAISWNCAVIIQDTFNVTANFVTLNPPAPVICSGKGGVTIAEGGAHTYVWSPSTGITTINDSVVKVNPTVTTTYTVTGTTAGGCQSSSTIVVTVNPTPTVTISTANPACPNSKINLTASGATSYSWIPNNIFTCPSCATTQTNFNGSAETYTVIGSSGGCIDTTEFAVTPFHVPIITMQSTLTACNPPSGIATATVSGSEPYSYAWSPAGGTSTEATGLGVGLYTFTVKDTNGCLISAEVEILATASPSVTITPTFPMCDSSNGQVQANPFGGQAPYSYSWSPGGNTNSIDTRVSAGIYNVTVTDENGCTCANNIILGNGALGYSFDTIFNVRCRGQSNGGAGISVSLGSPPYTYSWGNGDVSDTVYNLSAGTYTVQVTDKNNCTNFSLLSITQPSGLSVDSVNGITSCFGGDNGEGWVIAIGATPPYSYLWSNAQTTDTAVNLSAGVYTVTVTDYNGCTHTTTDVIHQPSQLGASVGNTSATCGNNGSASVIAAGGTPPYMYSWSVAGGDVTTIYSLFKGTYSIVVTDDNGCVYSSSTTIDTVGQTANVSSVKNVLCNGESDGHSTINVIGGDTTLYGYFWSPSGGTNATAVGLSAGVYTVTVTYIANGCTVLISDTIKQPQTLGTTVKYTLECGNILLAFDSTFGGIPPYSYNWYPSGGTTADVTLKSGSYTLTVVDANGCDEKLNLTAPLTDPIANFKPVPDTIMPGDSIKFLNRSIGGDAWYWDFGDQTGSIDSLPHHAYSLGGTYVVYLKVTNSLGCTDSIAENIVVLEGITVPNVFTPNGDGVNDFLYVFIYGLELDYYRMDIYNRWGQQIFESTSATNNWSGKTPSGGIAPAGTYYYILVAGDKKGATYNLKGFFQLIR